MAALPPGSLAPNPYTHSHVHAPHTQTLPPHTQPLPHTPHPSTRNHFHAQTVAPVGAAIVSALLAQHVLQQEAPTSAEAANPGSMADATADTLQEADRMYVRDAGGGERPVV